MTTTTTTDDDLARHLAHHPPTAGALDTLPIPALSRDGLIDALAGTERLLAHVQALQLRILSALAHTSADDRLDCTPDEVSAAVRWSPRPPARPCTARCSPWTPTPRTSGTRCSARRRVALYPEPDGMATLALYTPAENGAARLAALDAHAKPRACGDTRGLDQRRADTLTALVLCSVGVPPGGTAQPAAPVPALVQVVVGADSLLGINDEPAELRGFGPITAGQARAVAYGRDATWRRLLTAPDGTLLHADPHTYRPTAPVERYVRARDQRCTFPACTIPATRCDVDHITPYNHHHPEHGEPASRTTCTRCAAAIVCPECDCEAVM